MGQVLKLTTFKGYKLNTNTNNKNDEAEASPSLAGHQEDPITAIHLALRY
jgi:hypothetical protein